MVKQGLAIIGYFVWWSMENISIDRDSFEKMLKESGLKFSPPKLCHRTAFLEAVRSVKAKNYTHHLLIRNIQKGDMHVFGLVDENVDEKLQQLGYVHRCNLTFDQKSYAIACTAKHRALDLIQERYQYNLNHINTYEFRLWMMKVLKSLRKVSVRDKGGVYYVDSSYSEVIGRLEKLLANLSGVDFVTIPQINSEQSKKVIYKAFMEDIRNKIEKYRQSILNNKYTSEKGWTNALSGFKSLKEEISFYSEKLSFSAQEMEEELNKLQTELRQKLADE